MSRQVVTTVYVFDELSESAKEKAREWFREGVRDDDWYEVTYEDASRVHLIIKEFDIYRGTVDGYLTRTFKDTIEAIYKEHGKTSNTFKLAARYHLKLEQATSQIGGFDQTDDYEVMRKEFVRELLEEYLCLLRREYEYLLSNESIDETIRVNEYEFDNQGLKA